MELPEGICLVLRTLDFDPGTRKLFKPSEEGLEMLLLVGSVTSSTEIWSVCVCVGACESVFVRKIYVFTGYT